MDNIKQSKLQISLNEINELSRIMNEGSFIARFHELYLDVKSCLDNKGTIFFAGNGGSASDSDHLATEFVIRFKEHRKSIPSISLSSNTGLITACSNDYDFSKIFTRQCESLVKNNDIVIALSTSGSSNNIIELLEMCYLKKITCYMISGLKTPKEVKEKYQVIIIPTYTTSRIQEMHKLIGHSLCEEIELDYLT